MNASQLPSRQRFFLVFLLFLHTVNTYMDRICISSAKGAMQDEISGLDDQMMGYVFGIFAIGYALFQIPAGWFSDRAGPRHALTIVVIIWSIFTALTGAVFTAMSLLIVRFLFGVGEAGAYPGATRALYSWLPAKERGIGQGIFHSGARIGAAVSLIIMPLIIDAIGWRWTFVLNALIGLVWGIVWWVWYRNEPSEHAKVNAAEVELIRAGIAEEAATAGAEIPYIQVVTSANVLLAMFQYAASNITFFISMTWLQPYIRETWGNQYKYLASLPLLCGAIALWISGYAVTFLHRKGMPVMSRRVPAMVGYALGAFGLLMCTQTVQSASVWPFIACFALATFGVELTLSPSWAFCMDIGGERSGAVSAAMNMVGNMGAAVSAVAFPYFVANVTIPFFAESTGTASSFFVFAATMNALAFVAWMFMNPRRQLKPISASALRARLILFVALFAVVITMLVYTKFLLKKDDAPPSPEAPDIEKVGISDQPIYVAHDRPQLALPKLPSLRESGRFVYHAHQVVTGFTGRGAGDEGSQCNDFVVFSLCELEHSLHPLNHIPVVPPHPRPLSPGFRTTFDTNLALTIRNLGERGESVAGLINGGAKNETPTFVETKLATELVFQREGGSVRAAEVVDVHWLSAAWTEPRPPADRGAKERGIA